jgi:hypothetical protein
MSSSSFEYSKCRLRLMLVMPWVGALRVTCEPAALATASERVKLGT